MAKKRKSRVKFARVPSGIDTCGFCAMLASRGAVYSSEDTAGKDIHENCHCTCVPSWGGSTIEGYDPDEYYDRWKHPEIYEGLDSIVANSLACLRVAEKRGFVKYDKPLLSFLKTEEDKRDLVAHAALVRDGRRFRALAEDAPEGFSNIDLEMDGVKYEVKSPDGSNPRAVESNLRKAKKQFKKNYPEPIEDVRVIFNGAFYGQDDVFVASELAKRGQEHSISEVIHVSKAGNIRGTWKAQTPSTERPGLLTKNSIAHSASSMEEHRSPKPTTEVRSLGGVPLGTNENKSRGLSDSRDMASGMRRDATRILTPEDIVYVSAEAESIDIPTDILAFNEGTSTSFNDATGVINVRGDVFPDRTSTENRDRLSVRATLAHEYYGHRRYRGTLLRPGDWRDEFRASYRAAIDTPNLSAEDRAMLMVDAYQRASDAGVTLKYSREYTRIVYGYE